MQRSLGSRHSRSITNPLGASNNDLLVLLAWLVIFGVGLRLLVGWPTMVPLPEQLPSWTVLQVWAVSPGGSLQGLISVAALVAWAVWLWTLASVILRAAVDIADALTRGARWVGSIRRASDWLTLPLVRHAVDASLAGLLLVRVVAQPGVASASRLPDVRINVVTQRSADGAEQSVRHTRNLADLAQVADENSPEIGGDLIYTVKHGDTLSAIGLAFYGDADTAELIYQANLGRPEPDGRIFNRHGLIVPGWTLTIPSPTQGVIREEGGKRLYVVKDGDTLWGIAEQVLGSGDRYKELFDLNVGTARLAPDGPVLRKPNLIWPGLRLRLPDQPTRIEDSPGESNPAAAAPTNDAEPPERQTTRSASTPEPSQEQAEGTPTTASVVARTTSTPASLSVPSATPEALPLVVPSPPGTRQVSPDLPDATAVAGSGAAGAAAIVAAGALIVRRRRRAPVPNGPETDVQVEGGFAESDPVEGLARRLANTSDPPRAVASLMSQAYATVLLQQLSAEDMHRATTGVALAGVRHGHTATTLMLTAPVPARPYLVRAMRAAAEHAFGEHVDVDGLVSHDGDVLVRLTWDSRRPVPEKVLELVGPESEPGVWQTPSLVRLLVGYDRQPIDVNWHELSNVLVVSPTGERAESPLVALVASLASARPPEELGVTLIARPHMLPDQLGLLPHGLGDPIDPEDASAVDQGLTRLRQELDARITNGHNTEHADVVVVVREICDLDQNALAQLAPIASAGPAHGIRVVAATERPVTELVMACKFLDEFGTRLVLQTRDEEESIVVIGTPGAEELGRGGHALLRLESRTPIQGWACRVPSENLARLLSLMGTRAPSPSAPPEPETVVELNSCAQDEVDDSDVELRESASWPPPNAPAVEVQPLSARAANGSRQVSSIHESPLLQKLRKAPIKVRCFGARDVWHDNRVLDLREAELLLLLAAHPVRGVQSEALADMLWEETLTDPERALRVRRSRLRKELRTLVPDLIGDPLPGDSAHGERVVSLNPDVISSDVHEFQELVHSASRLQGAAAMQAYEEALALYGGDLLDSPDVPNFRWMYDGPQLALTLRSDYHRVHRDARLRLAELLAAGPDSGVVRAEELFSGLCAEEPENERLWAALFRIHERAGNSLGFESAVHKLQFALAELVSGEPDPETISLPPNLNALVNQVRSRFETIAVPRS